MRLGKETKEIFYNYETEMTDDEFKMLRSYADDNISIQELDSMLVNWAVVDILKKQLEMKVEETTCQRGKKKSKKKALKKKTQKVAT